MVINTLPNSFTLLTGMSTIVWQILRWFNRNFSTAQIVYRREGCGDSYWRWLGEHLKTSRFRPDRLGCEVIYHDSKVSKEPAFSILSGKNIEVTRPSKTWVFNKLHGVTFPKQTAVTFTTLKTITRDGSGFIDDKLPSRCLCRSYEEKCEVLCGISDVCGIFIFRDILFWQITNIFFPR